MPVGAQHVDAVVRVARMDEHLLVLLVPVVHPVPVERDQVLDRRRARRSGRGSTRRRPRRPCRRRGSCSRTPRPSSGSACGDRWARAAPSARPRAGSSRSAGGPTRAASSRGGCRRPSRRRRRRGSASGVGSRYSARPGAGGSKLNVPAGLRPSGPLPVIRPMRLSLQRGAAAGLSPRSDDPEPHDRQRHQEDRGVERVPLGPAHVRADQHRRPARRARASPGASSRSTCGCGEAIAAPVMTSTPTAIERADPEPPGGGPQRLAESSRPRSTGTTTAAEHQLAADEERHRQQMQPQDPVPEAHKVAERTGCPVGTVLAITPR